METLRSVSAAPPEPLTPAPEPSDADLVAMVVSGDRSAWGPLVDRYKRLVYSIPRRYGFPEDVCDDVFQTVFALLLREVQNVRDPAALTKWLMTTTHRECWRVSRARKASGLPEVELAGSADQLPDELAQKWERQHLIQTALGQLGGRCEALLRAIFLDRSDPSYAEISRRLGMPVGSIGPVRARCLEKLMALLSDRL